MQYLKITHVLIGMCIASGIAMSAAANAGPGARGHSHEHFSAGQPGDPKKSARSVEVVMREGDGKMMFVPDRIEIRKGEQIKFVLRNDGELAHEFVLATKNENIKHAALMQKFPDMEHDDPNAKKLEPKNKGEFIWRFTKRGTFEYGCMIPGHREAGMFGIIVVK